MRHILIVFLVLFPLSIFAQYDEMQPMHSNEYGAGFTIAMSGFGLGGFYRIALPNFYYIGAQLDFFMMRDEKEFTYYNPYTGYPIELNKFNRLFFIPFNLEFKKRFFQNSIDESFRPYLVALSGVTFGMNFPRDNNIEYSQLPPDEQARIPRSNEYRITYSFAIGVGVDFTTNENFYFSIRPQYRFNYFPKSIAGKENHSNFEIRLEMGKRSL
ncbi:MAG: hypothetical protein P8048_03770 [Calditrichia bacterium]|jgi:hypothetical protein